MAGLAWSVDEGGGAGLVRTGGGTVARPHRNAPWITFPLMSRPKVNQPIAPCSGSILD
jgi:hypothetical protein